MSSISAVSGSSPAGPGACVATFERLGSAVSKTDVSEMVVMVKLAFYQVGVGLALPLSFGGNIPRGDGKPPPYAVGGKDTLLITAP